MDSVTTTRRKFFKLGASMVLATTASSAGAAVRFKRKSPASLDLVEVGILTTAGGHSKGIWTKFSNPTEGSSRRTGMIVTKVWTLKDDVADFYKKTFGVERENKMEGMIGKVDGVLVDDFYGVAYNYKMARPYLEAGVPTFVNRPFGDSMKKVRDMTTRAKKDGAPLMTASSFEHIKEVHTVRKKVKLDEITGYEAWNSCSDYYSHGLHGVWWAYAAVGGSIKAVSMKSKNWRTCANPHDPEKSGITYVIYKDRGKVGPFIGKINEGQMPEVGGNNCSIVIQPGNQTHIHHWVDSWGRDQYLWIPMLHRIQHMFETGEMYQTYDEIEEKCAMFIGAFYSHLEREGKMVFLDNIPESWAIGSPHGVGSATEIDKIYAEYFGQETGAITPE